MEKLERSFYRKTALVLAKDLLGKYLVFHNYKEQLVGKIVETEAYMGFNDKGSHTYNGKRTPRVETMYGEEGHAYVYMIYGMYNCFNVVAAEKDIAQAVLIRALEPVKGLEVMSLNRFKKPLDQLKKTQIIGLTNGPGKLCNAFGITREMNGEDLTKDRLYICTGVEEKFHIVETTRIGIDYAEEAKDFPWRFYIKDNKFVSKP
ncbi:DNA-3-methyladenine glycosylase [Proteiniborus sp. DW1]|uniref:DNA-3-methyladenine glycosylase n=1 Tax=Proteiniborus sp. DW1 TaxID=1889883 RepID=UPI00092E15C6|nr:DNA-3-methyladenine glycosylase [Proteiniborus sp. DW1]SCG82928.1 DNA-3-methyladenine glycosylase [Proteiniborus sp. DW1]